LGIIGEIYGYENYGYGKFKRFDVVLKLEFE